MEIKISGLLKRYFDLLKQKSDITTEVIMLLQQHGIYVDKSDISIHQTILKIKASSNKKQKIFIKKTELLKNIKEHNINITDIV